MLTELLTLTELVMLTELLKLTELVMYCVCYSSGTGCFLGNCVVASKNVWAR
jgi:hypothetical protein